MIRFSISLIFVVLASTLNAQKTPLTLDLHDSWQSLKSFELSANGEYLVYEIAPLSGDGFVVVQELATLKSDTFKRATNFKFDTESEYVAFLISPMHDSLRAMKLREVKEKDLPKDTLGIFNFKADSLQVIPGVKSFEISGENTQLLSYTIEEYVEPKPAEEKKKRKKKKSKQKQKKPTKTPKDKKGATTLYNPISGFMLEFPHATESTFAEENNAFAVVRFEKSNWDSAILETVKDTTVLSIQENATNITKLAWSKTGTQLAYLQTTDTTKTKNYSLKLATNTTSSTIADSSSTFKYIGFAPNTNANVYFSEDGNRLYFGIAPLVEEEPKDTLLKDEKAQVDIWHYQDLRIQPEQKKQLKKDEKSTFLTVYHIQENKIIQLADSTLDQIRVDTKHNALYAVAYDRNPYSISRTWEYPWKSDLYWIDTKTGNRTKLLTGKKYAVGISEFGKYAHWYNPSDANYYAVRIGTADTINLTQQLTEQGEIFFDESAEIPADPYPLGIEGWTKNDAEVLIKAKNGIWVIDLAGNQKPIELSNGLAKKLDLDISTRWFDDEFKYFNLDSTIFIHAQSRKTNKNYYFLWSLQSFDSLYAGDFNLRSPLKAKDANQFIFRKETFKDYPNIYVIPQGELTQASFKQSEKLTTVNPQQQNYAYGSVEKYFWTDATGNNAKGLLFKPDNFDSTKAYPLIIYFYEKNFDTEHYHRPFRPSHSTISIPFYTSNNYIVFIPDIHYVTGHPAQDAYNAIVSGAQSLASKPYVDSTKMGIQGQSWGGYQVAALVTKTNLFAAAMAGAPVSNMTSAYGGIRWGSGLSRMFQYEKTQSRIGNTLWEARDLYIENSPVFHLNKVETPLLIMHNDQDGAVPWYQGIELYMGMRRLQKPAWMLVYNNEQHNLRKLPNRKDLSKRMFEFFNHYLKGDEMPAWMKDGVEAINKNQNEGYGQ